METAALFQRRLGSDAVRVLFDAFLPALTVTFVDEELHRVGASAYLGSLRRATSLVDWISFELMRDAGIERALAFDSDFEDEGFELVA